MKCAEVLKIGGGGGEAREDISTRIESIPGRNRNRNNTHLEKFLNLDDITNSFLLFGC